MTAGTGFEARRAAVLSFLTEHRTATTPHLFGDLQAHLEGVESLVRAWGGDDRLALAALGHATYGTDGFAPHLLEVDSRPVLAAAIGEEAESQVYFYAACERNVFYPQLCDPATTTQDLRFRDRFTGEEQCPDDVRIREFVDLTYANEVELAAASPGGPAEWTFMADFCQQTERWSSPSFYEGAMAILRPTS